MFKGQKQRGPGLPDTCLKVRNKEAQRFPDTCVVVLSTFKQNSILEDHLLEIETSIFYLLVSVKKETVSLGGVQAGCLCEVLDARLPARLVVEVVEGEGEAAGTAGCTVLAPVTGLLPPTGVGATRGACVGAGPVCSTGTPVETERGKKKKKGRIKTAPPYCSGQSSGSV